MFFFIDGIYRWWDRRWDKGDRGVRETADEANWAKKLKKKTSAIIIIITCNAAQTDDWG